MHLPRTKLLVERLRAAYKSSGVSIASLAQELGGVLSSQGITEIFGERANPTSEQTLAILDFLKDKNMTTPKTLGEAKEMIDDLRLELKLLKGVSAPAASTPKPPTVATPTKPAAPNPAPSTRSTDMVIRPEKPVTELDRLRVALNAEQDSEKRAAIYRQIKQVERDARANESRRQASRQLTKFSPDVFLFILASAKTGGSRLPHISPEAAGLLLTLTEKS